MALIQYSFRSEVLKENTEIYVILPTYEVFRDPEKKGAETYYKEYERKKTLYVLHGGSDDASLYLRRTRLEEYALERRKYATVFIAIWYMEKNILHT